MQLARFCSPPLGCFESLLQRSCFLLPPGLGVDQSTRLILERRERGGLLARDAVGLRVVRQRRERGLDLCKGGARLLGIRSGLERCEDGRPLLLHLRDRGRRTVGLFQRGF